LSPDRLGSPQGKHRTSNKIALQQLDDPWANDRGGCRRYPTEHGEGRGDRVRVVVQENDTMDPGIRRRVFGTCQRGGDARHDAFTQEVWFQARQVRLAIRTVLDVVQ
jgi:hypothetical protein